MLVLLCIDLKTYAGHSFMIGVAMMVAHLGLEDCVTNLNR